MLFNSWSFLLGFLPVVFFLYWFCCNRSIRLQNLLLLVSSYVFYGLWDYRFLSLVFISSFCDFVVGQAIEKSVIATRKKQLLLVSVFVNLGMLGIFKYFNFFSEGFQLLLAQSGIEVDWITLKVVLPVGISFYTFQTLGYTIDVYKGRIKASRDWLDYFTFVCFFPQLVAGPIERAAKLLPQFKKQRVLEYENGRSGVILILWGLFMKLVVADSCGQQVDYVYNNLDSVNSTYLLFGQFYFVFQIYCDFAGYSNIAIGTAKLFGFELSKNFNQPLFSRSIAEFWTRWHITLTGWFTDYVFKPLARKCRKNKIKILMTYFGVYSLIGLWHGPELSYILSFGSLGIYFIPRVLIRPKKRVSSQLHIREIPAICLTFFIVSSHLVFFRAASMEVGWAYYVNMFQGSFGAISGWALIPLAYILVLILVELANRGNELPLSFGYLPVSVRWPAYMMLLYLNCMYLTRPSPFIYFQF